MSSYLVENDTINKIISHLCEYQRDTFFLGFVERDYGYKLKLESNRQTLGQALYNLNQEAVNQRYREGAGAQMYHFKFIYGVTTIAAYKAVQCLKYQCSEGAVPDKPLFKLLEFLEADLAGEIISNIPAYEAAPWG